MKNSNIVFTEKDRLILSSYQVLADGLADYLGEGYEIVLHSLENLDKSVIKIINGHYTGRQAGAPITDFALSMLAKIREKGESERGYISYHSKNNKGEPLKATTITISGENGKVIGLLCINFYLNIPVYDFLNNFMMGSNERPAYISETFVDNLDELISSAVLKVKAQVNEDSSIMPSLKNKEIVTQLYYQGIFKLKDAVEKVAGQLDISKNTVYMHLRSLNESGK